MTHARARCGAAVAALLAVAMLVAPPLAPALAALLVLLPWTASAGEAEEADVGVDAHPFLERLFGVLVGIGAFRLGASDAVQRRVHVVLRKAFPAEMVAHGGHEPPHRLAARLRGLR